MKNKIFNILSLIFFIVLVCFIHIGTFLVTSKQITLLEFSNILHILGIISFIIYIFYKIINKKKITIYDIIILFLIICTIVSTIYAYDQTMAYIGVEGRYDGLYSILSYYSFFLLSTTVNKRNQKIIMNILIFFGVFQIAIGTIQTLRIENILGYDRSNSDTADYFYASGTLLNPNFYSSYILICLLYLLESLSKINKLKIFYSILLSIYIYGLIIGNTLTSILVFILVLSYYILKNINLKKIKSNIFSILLIFTLCLVTLVIVNKYKNNTLYKTMRNNVYEVIDIFKYGIKNTTGNSRIYVWKETLKEVPKNLLTGIGVDNFIYIKDGEPIIAEIKGESLAFDKAHNDYLQILITEGIFALIGYLVLIFYVLLIALKYKDNQITIAPFVGYILLTFIVFSVIFVVPIFYMIMGFIISNKELKHILKK